jgi:CheY-like chemotaxis protein
MPKILLVEDNPELREMLTRRLVKRNFNVVLAGDGDEGCRMARTEQPDLILMDMNLPILDGWEATRQLKTAADTQSIPIIALTADAMAGDREKALQAGCNDYETKPVDLVTLLDKMQRLLQAKVGT